MNGQELLVAPSGAMDPAARSRSALVPTVLALAVGTGAVIAVSPTAAVGAYLVAALGAWVWARPAVAAYLLIGLTPLVAGIDRGVVMPVLRPNEALELLLGATLAVRGLVRARSGQVRLPRLDRIELAVLLLAVTSSVLPLATMAVRGRDITSDDVLYGLALWKLAGVYLIVRCSATSDRQVLRCLHASVAAGAVVAVVGVLQGLDLLGVRGVLATYYAQYGDAAAITTVPRGGSTLSLPAATADLMTMDLALVTGLWLRSRRLPVLHGGLAALFVLATLAAGEFSSAIGLVVGVAALVLVTELYALLPLFGVLAGAGAGAVWPVVERRLEGFSSASGLPVSWIGRLHNLRTYFWPHLHSYGNVLLGVRPSARVHVDYHATGWVWIESGYTWLLWAGGVPLLASYVLFVHATASRSWAVARSCRDAAGVAGTAAFVGVVVTTVLMVFDPHLTYRGSADEMFALLALTAGAARGRRTAAARPGTRSGSTRVTTAHRTTRSGP